MTQTCDILCIQQTTRIFMKKKDSHRLLCNVVMPTQNNVVEIITLNLPAVQKAGIAVTLISLGSHKCSIVWWNNLTAKQKFRKVLLGGNQST